MQKIAAASLLYVLLAMPLVISPEAVSVLTFAVLVGWVLAQGLRIPIGSIHVIWPLALIVAIGLAGSLGNTFWDTFRDTWYMGKSVVLLLTAYVLAWYVIDLRDTLRVFLVVALLTSVFHLTFFVANPAIFEESIGVIRNKAGAGFLLTVIALAILASARRAGLTVLGGSPWLGRVIFALCLGSLMLSFSRTYLVTLLVMLVLSGGGLSLLRPGAYTARGVRTAFVRIALVAVIVVGAYQLASQTASGTSLMEKMGRSLDEVAAREYGHKSDMVRNWRGHETHRALTIYLEGTPVQYAFGRGYGALIDAGIRVKLGENHLRYLPSLHNGYAVLLIKTGAVGLLCYLVFFFRLIRSGYRISYDSRASLVVSGELLVGMALASLAMTVVVSGLINKELMNPAVILIGALLAHVRRMQWESQDMLPSAHERQAA